MSAQPVRVRRVYTAARRHPWVLGKIGDFKLWLGPYTPVQVVVAFLGAFILIKTVAWWSWLGPLPLVAWAVAVWAVRRPRIAGRAVAPAAVGWLMLLMQRPAGRGPAGNATGTRPRLLHSEFLLEDLVPETTAAAGARGQKAAVGAVMTAGIPLSPVQQLLAAQGVQA